jgi:hypothetical protein
MHQNGWRFLLHTDPSLMENGAFSLITAAFALLLLYFLLFNRTVLSLTFGLMTTESIKGETSALA